MQTLPRQIGTVIDKEVAVAAIAQGLAPAGAMPPIMLSTLGRPAEKSSLFVGAPVMLNHHARAAAPTPPRQPNPDAVAYSLAEKERLLKVGGFYATQNSTLPLHAVPEGATAWLGDEEWKLKRPQLPAYIKERKEVLRPYDLQAPAYGKLASTNAGGGTSGVSARHRA